MADSSSMWGGGNGTQLGRQLRGQEVASRPPSYLSHQGLYNSSPLRATASRFSLNEQFAATRREYEFGYDDASSILERTTIRSRHLNSELDPASIPATGAEETADFGLIALPLLEADDIYDVLCMSRKPSIESILRAYFRLFSLLDPGQQPPHLRHAAEAYSASIQRAVETLLDPCQGARYDLARYNGSFANIGFANDQVHLEYDGRVSRTKRSLASFDRAVSECELGASFNLQQAASHGQYDPTRAGAGIQLVHFEMGHATYIDLSELDGQLRRATQWLQQKRTTHGDKETDTGYVTYSNTGRLGGTVMTLHGSIYGLLKDRTPVPLRLDHYQPSFPRFPNRDRFVLLHHGLLQLLFGINLRHVISQRYPRRGATGIAQASASESCSSQEETVVEIGSTILPCPTAATRLSKPIVLPFDRHRSLLRLQTEQALWERKLPRLAATLERPTASGQLLLHVASGDWRSHADETCRYFTDFTRSNRRLLGSGLLSLLANGVLTPNEPRVEISFKNRGTFEPVESCLANQSLGQGICALDTALGRVEEGVWTVTTLAEPRYYSVSAKYAQDVNLAALELYRPRSMSAETHDSLSTKTTRVTHRPLRMEAEIGVDSLNAGYLALRCLKRVGRFSKVGFEVGFGRYLLHLSVYWSRLGQRINIPFYLCSRSNMKWKMLLLTTIIPFASLMLWELWDRFHRQKRRQQLLATLREQQCIQKRRAEADMLMTLMAPAVQNKQKLESMGNGLVILSAKYGVKARDAGEVAAWGAAEVADVTVAVAALIDRGALFIPSGVRKSYILGFWDPEPAEEKVLHVRYSYQGKEATVEVRGDDEQLVLPPPS
ncbi:hypothetical protein GGR55DRAFT_553398 [Xylaria sp. FL0064]|nr:hypothetical protein GGR55DRAFT_553398 [Xylaria sp. FL0064]